MAAPHKRTEEEMEYLTGGESVSGDAENLAAAVFGSSSAVTATTVTVAVHEEAPPERSHADIDALLRNGKSLLPSGITGVDGQFNVGSAVDIVGPDGAVIARGVARGLGRAIGGLAHLHVDHVATARLDRLRLCQNIHRDERRGLAAA